ncbi:urea transporter [Ceraceosorus bombacis]|uniref:Urea transporter n=1 Tax=Ceraceosorus bombacis TaxID=401625 RepID=A0A0P1BRL4_9BASI|nr:urea transporter [Ceraceosorus bombacis]
MHTTSVIHVLLAILWLSTNCRYSRRRNSWTYGMRKLCPDGFTMAQYVRVRFGWPVGVLIAVVFVAFMLCFMLVELNTYGSVVSTLGGVNPTIAALIVAIITTIYTAYGGFQASLWTDNVQSIIILIFITIGGAAIGTRIELDQQRIDDSGLLKAHSLGGQLFFILPAALIFSQMFNQGFWQRAFASKTNKTLYLSVALATLPLFAICFLVGITGPLAQWAGLFDGITPEDDGSSNFFYIIATLPNWVQGIVLVLAGALTSSAYDTFQSAQISTIENDVLLGRVNLWWCRLILVALNVPAVVLAVKNVDILQVFLIADLGAAAVLPGTLLGLIPQLWWLNGLDVFIGACGGFFTVFIAGTIYYHGDAKAGGDLIILPQGLYVGGDDYSVLMAFFAAPLGSVGWSLASGGARFGAQWLFARVQGREFSLHRVDFDTTNYALPQDRPADLHGVHGSGNPRDRAGFEADLYEPETGHDAKGTAGNTSDAGDDRKSVSAA